MDATSLGNNWLVTSARALTTGYYQSVAGQQQQAQNSATSNAFTVSGILNQPFFGLKGGIGGLFQNKWVRILLLLVAFWWVNKKFLHLKLPFGLGGRTRSYAHLARARAAKRRKSGKGL